MKQKKKKQLDLAHKIHSRESLLYTELENTGVEIGHVEVILVVVAHCIWCVVLWGEGGRGAMEMLRDKEAMEAAKLKP